MHGGAHTSGFCVWRRDGRSVDARRIWQPAVVHCYFVMHSTPPLILIMFWGIQSATEMLHLTRGVEVLHIVLTALPTFVGYASCWRTCFICCLVLLNQFIFTVNKLRNNRVLFMQKDPDVAITVETVADCLSLLCKTGDGLAHAYVRFDAPDWYVKRVLKYFMFISYHIISYIILPLNVWR